MRYPLQKNDAIKLNQILLIKYLLKYKRIKIIDNTLPATETTRELSPKVRDLTLES